MVNGDAGLGLRFRPRTELQFRFRSSSVKNFTVPVPVLPIAVPVPFQFHTWNGTEPELGSPTLQQFEKLSLLLGHTLVSRMCKFPNAPNPVQQKDQLDHFLRMVTCF